MKTNIYIIIITTALLSINLPALASPRTSATRSFLKLFRKPIAEEVIEQGIKHNSDDIVKTVIRNSDGIVRATVKNSDDPVKVILKKTPKKGKGMGPEKSISKQITPGQIVAGGAGGALIVGATSVTAPARAIAKTISGNDAIAETGIRYLSIGTITVMILIVLLIAYRFRRKPHKQTTSTSY